MDNNSFSQVPSFLSIKIHITHTWLNNCASSVWGLFLGVAGGSLLALGAEAFIGPLPEKGENIPNNTLEESCKRDKYIFLCRLPYRLFWISIHLYRTRTRKKEKRLEDKDVNIIFNYNFY